MTYNSPKLIENKFFVILMFFVVGLSIYFNSLNVPFLFDDEINIKNRELQIEELSVASIQDAYTKGTHPTRAISNLSFAINYYFSGYDLPYLHLTNIYIHILSSIFLYLFLRLTLALPVNINITKAAGIISFSSALIWLTHPIATQSVTYLVQRMNSLAAMFYILSLFLYAYGRAKQQHNRDLAFSKAFVIFTASFACGVLAICSKEIAVTLPLIIIVYEWYFFQDLNKKWLKLLFPLLAAFAVFVLAIAWIYLGVDWSVILEGYQRRDFSLAERLLTQPRVVCHYISLLFYPHPDRLIFDYNYPVSQSLLSPATTLPAILFIGIGCCIAVICVKRERFISFCIIWFFANLSIESTFIPLEMIFEHRTYLPSMFVWPLFFIIIFKVARLQLLVIGLAIIIGGVLSYWTIKRNIIWQNSIIFWHDSLKKSPGKYRIHLNLGAEYAKAGDLISAKEHTLKALQLAPDDSQIHNNLGAIYLRLGEDDGIAEKYLKKALSVNSKDVNANMDLAVLYERTGRAEEAIHLCKRVLVFADDSLRANKFLGILLVRYGDPSEGLKFLEKVNKVLPDDAEVLFRIGEASYKLGDIKKANTSFEKVVRIKNDHGQAHYNIAKISAFYGKDSKALQHYRKAERSNFISAHLWYNMGNVMTRLGMYNDAEIAFKKTLNHSIAKDEVWNNLGLVYIQRENFDEALHCFQNAVAINPENKVAEGNLKLTEEYIGDAGENR